MEDVIRELPGDAVHILVQFNGLTVMPANPLAAPIHLHYDQEGGFIDFSFGESLSTFELDGDDFMEQLRELSDAVVQGRCGEKRGWISTSSWLEPVGRTTPAVCSTFFYFRLIRSSRRFRPYAE